MDRELFARHVREALAHLYDPAFLQEHPIRPLLAARSEPDSAETLQRILVDAIQQLKPSRDSPQYLPRWRRYRHLCLRYLEGADPVTIAEQLSISERQVRRDHQDALDALTSVLWARYSRVRWDGGAKPPEEAPDQADGTALETELVRIASTPARGPVSLGEVVASVLTTLSPLSESRRVGLDVALAEVLPPTTVDRVVLRQILLSLLVYAVNADGAERVGLSAADAGDRLHVRISIYRTLTSPGARPEAGASGSAARSENPLAASRRLVELQGGAFEHRGQAGDDEADGEAEEIDFSLPCVPLTSVLVIDDNPDFIRLFRRYLGNSPYRVVQSGDAQEALEMARLARPDLITLDVMMPSQDGWETLQALKSEPRTRDIPVLVCSVLQEPSLALALGAAEFLTKPVTRQALLAALERCAGDRCPVSGVREVQTGG